MLGSIIGKTKWKWTACGKHPIAADYFSIGLENAISNAFSSWVANGYRKVPKAENSKTDLISWRFWAKGTKKEIICGVVRDSSDSLGRKFPLLVIGSGGLKGWEENIASLPAAFEQTWSWVDYFAAKRMVDYQQLEDEFQMIPTPKAEWQEYSNRLQDHPNPSFEELEKAISRYTQPDMIFMPLSNWVGGNMMQVIESLHLIIHNKFKIQPNTVFMGGRSESPYFFVSNRPLANDDFLKLWQVSVH